MACANVFGLLLEQAPGLDGMRCALVLFSYAALEGFSGLQVSRAPGSTVVSSHSSLADLAENRQLRSRRWSVDVGIANAISKPGFSQASSADQLCCGCTDHDRRPIGFILSEYSPGHTRQLIGQGYCGHVTVEAGCELSQPRTQTGRLLRALLQDGTGPLHQESSQVRVPAFANPKQLLLAVPRHHSKCIADGAHSNSIAIVRI